MTGDTSTSGNSGISTLGTLSKFNTLDNSGIDSNGNITVDNTAVGTVNNPAGHVPGQRHQLIHNVPLDGFIGNVADPPCAASTMSRPVVPGRQRRADQRRRSYGNEDFHRVNI